MRHLDDVDLGWLSPVLAYAMACAGAAVGLRCTVRALGTTGRARRNWLVIASSALGTGIWTMHFVAMLGFGGSGTDIRYDVLLTVVSLVVAVAVVCGGVFVVSRGQGSGRAVLTGGFGTGLGIVCMHYLGMAAVRLHGQVHYEPELVGLSVLIAVAAATVSLWAAFNVTSPGAVTAASLTMGAAISGMHYTSMLSVRPEATPSGQMLPGATWWQLVFPLVVGLGSCLFLTAAFAALFPAAAERDAPAAAGDGRDPLADAHAERCGRGVSTPAVSRRRSCGQAPCRS
ncbi:MAG TPA: MHYT domain-containing protein [Streptomyces sp.]|nr:MHYT domain-containing protein [Streptomyces sp.]